MSFPFEASNPERDRLDKRYFRKGGRQVCLIKENLYKYGEAKDANSENELIAQIQSIYSEKIGSSGIDSLTGMYNNGFFQLCLENEINRSMQSGDLFCLAVLDIDHFDDYNVRYGSVQADYALRQLSTLIVKTLRRVDVPARYAGDVFTIIMPKIGLEGARITVERLQKRIKRSDVGTLNVSAGLSMYPADGNTRGELFSSAQESLFQAKLTGTSGINNFQAARIACRKNNKTILVVDDEVLNIKLIQAMVHAENYNLISAQNGQEALKIIQRNDDLDLILLDIMMPEMSGYEVCRIIKARECSRLIPVILLTALDDSRSKINGIEAGADDFITKPPNQSELLARIRSLINVKKLNNRLTTIKSVLLSMANAIEAKDPYTQGHTKRVSELAVKIGERMGCDDEILDALQFGGILHDIGKIGVSRQILNKPGKLSEDEFKLVKQHPEIGYNICRPLKKTLGIALKVIRQHHEKLDGSGYPDKLCGDSISIETRILSVADIYDALTSNRSYRDAMPKEHALSILENDVANGKLDGDVYQSLIKICH